MGVIVECANCGGYCVVCESGELDAGLVELIFDCEVCLDCGVSDVTLFTVAA